MSQLQLGEEEKSSVFILDSLPHYLINQILSGTQQRLIIIKCNKKVYLRRDIFINFLVIYKEKLNAKFSLNIVDKYVFPIDAGNPDIRISNYI